MAKFTYPEFVEDSNREGKNIASVFLKKASSDGSVVLVDGEKYKVKNVRDAFLQPTRLSLENDEGEDLVIEQEGGKIVKPYEDNEEVSEVHIIVKRDCSDCGGETELVRGEISGIKCVECGSVTTTYDDL